MTIGETAGTVMTGAVTSAETIDAEGQSAPDPAAPRLELRFDTATRAAELASADGEVIAATLEDDEEGTLSAWFSGTGENPYRVVVDMVHGVFVVEQKLGPDSLRRMIGPMDRTAA